MKRYEIEKYFEGIERVHCSFDAENKVSIVVEDVSMINRIDDWHTMNDDVHLISVRLDELGSFVFIAGYSDAEEESLRRIENLEPFVESLKGRTGMLGHGRWAISCEEAYRIAHSIFSHMRHEHYSDYIYGRDKDYLDWLKNA